MYPRRLYHHWIYNAPNCLSLVTKQLLGLGCLHKDVLMGILKRVLLRVTMTVIHVVGQRFWQYKMALIKVGIPIRVS